MEHTAFGILRTTFSNAQRGFRECKEREGISTQKLLASYLWNCLIRDVCSVAYRDVAGSIQGLFPQKARIFDDTRKQVVIAFPGLLTSVHGMSGLLNALEADNKIVEPIEGRVVPWRNMKSEILERRRQVRTIMNRHQDKQVCMFGFSQGGYQAHRFARREGTPSVSFGTPVHPDATPAGYVFAYYRQHEALKGVSIPKNSIQLTEAFSFANPLHVDGVKQVRGVHSHFPINRPEVIEVVLQEINTAFANSKTDSVHEEAANL